MKMRLALLCCFLTVQLSAQPLLLEHGRVIDVERGEVLSGQSVLIEGGKIRAVGKNLEAPAGVERIDVSGKYIMPGLVDAHIHLFQSGGIYTRPDAIDLRQVVPYEAERAWLRDQAGDMLQRYLAAGITTVVDVGGPLYNYPIRDAQNGDPATATVFLTGPLVSTYQPEEFQVDDPPIVKVNDAEEARALVRQQLPYRPDFIKIWYIVGRGQTAADNLPIVQATIEESHRHGLRVAVHATQLETARLAVAAGADFLVHSVDDAPVDDAFVALLLEKGTVYIPTLVVSKNYYKTFSQTHTFTEADFRLAQPRPLGSLFDARHLAGDFPFFDQYAAQKDRIVGRYDRAIAIMNANLQKLSAAGVRIAAGTDAGNIGTLHASSYYDELAAMERAGLSTAQILRAATLGGAQALDKAAEMSTVEAGKNADLLVLDANPLENLDHLKAIAFVVHEGRMLTPDDLIPVSPELLAQQQLNAYNARNIDAFLEPYAEDVEVYRFPAELQYRGKAAMRERYAALFDARPDLHCELVNRIVLGNTVIDQERVIRQKGQPPIEAIAIYKIRDGKIRQVYFVAE